MDFFRFDLGALGENPAAVDAVGVNVFGLRYLYVVMGGALAGLGGAYLSLAYACLLYTSDVYKRQAAV